MRKAKYFFAAPDESETTTTAALLDAHEDGPRCAQKKVLPVGVGEQPLPLLFWWQMTVGGRCLIKISAAADTGVTSTAAQ
jgi:hypothetical protein